MPLGYEFLLAVGINEENIEMSIFAYKKKEYNNINVFSMAYLNSY